MFIISKFFCPENLTLSPPLKLAVEISKKTDVHWSLRAPFNCQVQRRAWETMSCSLCLEGIPHLCVVGTEAASTLAVNPVSTRLGAEVVHSARETQSRECLWPRRAASVGEKPGFGARLRKTTPVLICVLQE